MIEQLKVGAINYTVVLEEAELDGSKCSGLVDYDQTRISVSPDQSIQMQPQTLIHEIIHVIMHQAGFTEHNESVIEALSYGWLQVLRDNPNVTAYLAPMQVYAIWDGVEAKRKWELEHPEQTY